MLPARFRCRQCDACMPSAARGISVQVLLPTAASSVSAEPVLLFSDRRLRFDRAGVQGAR